MMKNSYILILVTFITSSLILSCSHINRDARDEYNKVHSFRHGIVPILDSTKKGTPRVTTLDVKSIARGKELYQVNCMSCHGEYGRGDGVDSVNFQKEPSDISNIAKEVLSFL